MQTQGTIRRWDGEKGYGFIGNAQHNNVFFHIRDYRGPQPPTIGSLVDYEEIQVGRKGPRAMNVRPQGAQHTAPVPGKPPAPGGTSPRRPAQRPTPPQPAPSGAMLAKGLMLLWLVLLLWAGMARHLPWWLLGALAVLNLLTFWTYATDKNAAQQGRRRTPERTLHLMALLGGWPAAWWAQQWMRHKSAKPEFRRMYWATIFLHCAGLAALWHLGVLPG